MSLATDVQRLWNAAGRLTDDCGSGAIGVVELGQTRKKKKKNNNNKRIIHVERERRTTAAAYRGRRNYRIGKQ